MMKWSFQFSALIVAAFLVLGISIPAITYAQGSSAGMDVSIDATYDELLDYGQEHRDVYPNPEHMWSSSKSGRSLYASLPQWKTVDGVKTFVDGNGEVYASPALKVIDVSEWQGKIDWAAVASSDVDGVILRAGWGIGNLDQKFEYNLQQVRKYNIPYGFYLYSYAHNSNFASREAAWTAEIIEKFNCTDMSFPVYYDLENWGSYTEGGTAYHVPDSVSAYETIVDAYVSALASRGFSYVNVYSYRYYVQTVLNSKKILSRVSWIAEYNPTLAIENSYYSGQYGWQYTDSGSVPGINGAADISAFSSWDYRNVNLMPTVELADGTYYVNSHLKDSSGIQIAGSSLEEGAAIELGSAAFGSSQRFIFTRQNDGSYSIINEASGKALEVKDATAKLGAMVHQVASTGSASQRWYIRDSGAGYYIQSALGNWVLDVAGANTLDGTAIRLYVPNGTASQLFMMAEADAEVPQGKTFTIETASGGFVLDIKGASTANNAAAQLYEQNGTDAQLFFLEPAGNGIYSIINERSRKAVEVSSGRTTNGSKIAQYECNGTLSQHWILKDAGNGFFCIVNCKTGKALDIPSGKTSNGVQLQLYTLNGTDAQRWKLVERESMRQRLDAFALKHAGTIAEGTYAIGVAGAERQVIDVNGASKVNAVNIQLYESNGTNAQRWLIEEDELGYLTISNVGSGKVFDVANGSTANGANVQQYNSNGTYAQKWIAVRNDDDTVTFYSALKEGFVIDAKNGKTANGTNINVYEFNGTNAQRYFLYSADAPNSNGRSVEDGVYTIASTNGKVLDVPGAKTSDGVQLQIYPANGTIAQLFRLEFNETNGFYSIKSIGSNRVLDVAKGDFVPASPVNQWGTSAGSSIQRYWSLKPAGENSYFIQSAATGQILGCSSSGKLITVPQGDSRAMAWKFNISDILWSQDEVDAKASLQGPVIDDGTYTLGAAANDKMALDVKNASRLNAANVQLYTNNGTDAQKWKVENVQGGYIRIVNVGSGRVLDVSSGSAEAGSNVQQYSWNASRAQLWLPIRQNDGAYVLYSALGDGLVLDVKNGSMKNGSNVQVYTINNTSAQRFIFLK